MNIKEFIRTFTPPLLLEIKKVIYDYYHPNLKLPVKDEFYEYAKELNIRAELPLNDIEELSKEITFEQIGTIASDDIESCFYGDFYTLMKYIKMPVFNIPPKGIVMQHGMIYQGVYDALRRRKNKLFFVWSSEISKWLKCEDFEQEPIVIGAPFFYANSILSREEIDAEKKRLGKNLLAFPMHSTHFVETVYNPVPFLNILKEERKRFDTVRVCLYWKNVQNGDAKIYQDEGFECVCCGHLFDQLFLERQKALFEIADATISNGLGSHIGYSVFMNKPHRLYDDLYETKDTGKFKESEEMSNLTRKSLYRNKLIDAFCKNEEYIITEQQRIIVDELWGISEMKNREELKKVVENCYG